MPAAWKLLSQGPLPLLLCPWIPHRYLRLSMSQIKLSSCPDLPPVFSVSVRNPISSLDVIPVLPPSCPLLSALPTPRGLPLRQLLALSPLLPLQSCCLGPASSSLPFPVNWPLPHASAMGAGVPLLRPHLTQDQLTSFHWVPAARRIKPRVQGAGVQGLLGLGPAHLASLSQATPALSPPLSCCVSSMARQAPASTQAPGHLCESWGQVRPCTGPQAHSSFDCSVLPTPLDPENGTH